MSDKTASNLKARIKLLKPPNAHDDDWLRSRNLITRIRSDGSSYKTLYDKLGAVLQCLEFLVATNPDEPKWIEARDRVRQERHGNYQPRKRAQSERSPGDVKAGSWAQQKQEERLKTSELPAESSKSSPGKVDSHAGFDENDEIDCTEELDWK